MENGADSTSCQLKMPPLTTDLEGKEIEALIGPTNRFNNGQLVWLVKFKSVGIKNRIFDLVPSNLMNQYFPQSVIKYFEGRIRILHRQTASEMLAPSASAAVVIPESFPAKYRGRDRGTNGKKPKTKMDKAKKIVQKSKALLTFKPRPYKCQECGSSFSRSDNLISHRRIHSDDVKPFKCLEPSCERTFRTRSHMKSHWVMHSDLTPFHCSYPKCGKSFKRKSNLTQHLLCHHPQ